MFGSSKKLRSLRYSSMVSRSSRIFGTVLKASAWVDETEMELPRDQQLSLDTQRALPPQEPVQQSRNNEQVPK